MGLNHSCKLNAPEASDGPIAYTQAIRPKRAFLIPLPYVKQAGRKFLFIGSRSGF